MPRNEVWSRAEVAATVADYLDMLRQELAGAPYSKAAHRRELAARLDGRSGPSIEFKRANISAVLAERGLRHIAGYKPRGNYQRALSEELDRQLATYPDLLARMQLKDAPVEAPATLGEDAVIAAVKQLLTGEGWSVVHVASAALKEKGVDLEARLGERRLIVEAKGWPASTYKDGRPKKWLPYPQARAYFSNALLPLLIGAGAATTTDRRVLRRWQGPRAPAHRAQAQGVTESRASQVPSDSLSVFCEPLLDRVTVFVERLVHSSAVLELYRR